LARTGHDAPDHVVQGLEGRERAMQRRAGVRPGQDAGQLAAIGFGEGLCLTGRARHVGGEFG
jgi:hypothetical protein